MYQCENCKELFDEPKIIISSYESELGLLNEFMSITPRNIYVCPYCSSENFIERREDEMERKIIDLNNTIMTLEEVFNLENYIWKNDKLIPEELINNE